MQIGKVYSRPAERGARAFHFLFPRVSSCSNNRTLYLYFYLLIFLTFESRRIPPIRWIALERRSRVNISRIHTYRGVFWSVRTCVPSSRFRYYVYVRNLRHAKLRKLKLDKIAYINARLRVVFWGRPRGGWIGGGGSN